MTGDFSRPANLPPRGFEAFASTSDSALINQMAHDTAAALLARVRAHPDAATVERLVSHTDEHGIDVIAELWSHASPHSLPGALWRVYLTRSLITSDPEGMSFAFRRGAETLRTIDEVVAGAATPVGSVEIRELADHILRGTFVGDFAVSLERAAAFARICSTGFTSLADDADSTDRVHPERSEQFTRRAFRLSELAEALGACARLWRRNALD